MRNFLLTASFAAAMGALAMGSANAAPIATHGVISAPSVISDVQCRVVKRTVIRNGVRRTTTTRDCARRPVVRERVIVGPRRRAPAVGIGVRIR